MDGYINILKSKLSPDHFDKLAALQNEEVNRFVAHAIELCEPDSVWVGDDSDEDMEYCRQLAIDNGEEIPLKIKGHTVHFDGYFDQARKKEVTRYLVPEGESLDPKLNQVSRSEGIKEIEGLQRGAYRGRKMLVRFFCLGPPGSVYAIPCLQITDSAYVVHSEDLLYRGGYGEFRRQSGNPGFEFFKFRHATGEVDERMTSSNHDRNRVYMDQTENTVYSVNTQYAGNTVGLKKLSLRLAIRKADREGWLAEHMFIMRVNGPKGRKTYLCGAYPSACGKTSTAMIPGENIVGDDLAYFRVINGKFMAVNVESGIFGIIQDVNAKGDPVIWDVLHKEGEVIFGNVLVNDGKPYWLGMGEDIPETGMNHVSMKWTRGMKGPDGKPTTCAHKNARYTVRIDDLENKDPDWNNSGGLPVGGIIYGGRDSDTSVPVRESFGWEHGICTMGAMLESETTAATIGAEGVRKWNVMSNMDFLSMSVSKYLKNNLEFAKDIDRPKIFGTNYFLKKDDKYLNGMLDKAVWVKWMELRIHGDTDGIETPVGIMPVYEDLRDLFSGILKKDYTREEYGEQFTLRVPENLAKLERMEEIYTSKVSDTPAILIEFLLEQRARLQQVREKYGDYISPFELSGR
ncbi:MAG: phosphoenolpyruvate carboxykinase (GTP) [Elusimicrobia bacterium]|nr:phosphoenolpyruvate carboxykinase (GTP) [Elusimicrobiota bacterium]